MAYTTVYLGDQRCIVAATFAELPTTDDIVIGTPAKVGKNDYTLSQDRTWVQNTFGGAVGVVQKTVDRGIFPNDLFETNWLLGDSSTAVTIAASGTQLTAAWEIGRVRPESGSVVIVVGGTGTVKLDANVSRDGINDKVTVAAATLSLATLSAGTYVLSLDNASLPYGHYLDFLCTEDGGANSVTVKVFGMGRNG